MQFLPFGYNQGDEEAWEEPIRLFRFFAVFATIVVIIWALGSIVLAVKDPIIRWGWIPDK